MQRTNMLAGIIGSAPVTRISAAILHNIATELVPVTQLKSNLKVYVFTNWQQIALNIPWMFVEFADIKIN